jgi:16S rRNA (adenine1518-N6/adenine1519-N6)-dimethyltransferase
MVQKEVAEKICNLSPQGSYWSNFVQTFYQVEILAEVDKFNFDPVPEVDSAILKFDIKPQPLVNKKDIVKYQNFLHHGFSAPRKMINKVFEKNILLSLKIDGNLRPQNLSIPQWVALFEKSRN